MTLSTAFIGLALLSLGIARYLGAIGVLTRTGESEQVAAVRRNCSRLSRAMFVGGRML